MAQPTIKPGVFIKMELWWLRLFIYWIKYTQYMSINLIDFAKVLSWSIIRFFAIQAKAFCDYFWKKQLAKERSVVDLSLPGLLMVLLLSRLYRWSIFSISRLRLSPVNLFFTSFRFFTYLSLSLFLA
jgi:hypothetical protein